MDRWPEEVNCLLVGRQIRIRELFQDRASIVYLLVVWLGSVTCLKTVVASKRYYNYLLNTITKFNRNPHFVTTSDNFSSVIKMSYCLITSVTKIPITGYVYSRRETISFCLTTKVTEFLNTGYVYGRRETLCFCLIKNCHKVPYRRARRVKNLWIAVNNQLKAE